MRRTVMGVDEILTNFQRHRGIAAPLGMVLHGIALPVLARIGLVVADDDVAARGQRA